MSAADEKLVPVSQPFDTMQAGIIQSALEDNNILCYVDNENMSAIRFGGMAIGAAAMTVMVPESQQEQAHQIISELGFA